MRTASSEHHESERPYCRFVAVARMLMDVEHGSPGFWTQSRSLSNGQFFLLLTEDSLPDLFAVQNTVS